ncbi:uncharacterized protein LOC134794047 [Cydia splendana]|uniref:uncharacterized protein LOC134794047 n=1 Tax=Cydia splendana TaxID=1100963 RepID=UPI00213675EC
MLRLTICLLVAKTAFAANAFPIDNTGYHPVGPDTNLVFNFQQIRRDQPAQVEMREENIHKYMNRPRTTTPIPSIDNRDMSPMRSENPTPYTAEQWNAVLKAPKYDGPVANWKNVPAPPTFPHWDNLANNQNNYENQYRQPIVVTEEPHWQEPEIRSRAVSSFSSTFEPVTFAPVTFAPTFAPRVPMRHSSRGNHRFNWDDVNTQVPTTTPINVPTAAPSRMPPPPVPTLSPWYDGF